MNKRIILIVILLAVSVILAACGGGSQLTYKISGDAKDATIAYKDADGETIEETVSLPWEISYDFKGTFDFEITAANSGETGTVVCEVWADERSLGSVQGNKFAECSGSITITKRGGTTETSSRFSSRSDGGTAAADVMPTREGEDLMATAAANQATHQVENAIPTPEPTLTATPTVAPSATPISTPTAAPLVESIANENGRFVFDADLDGNFNIYTINGDGSDLRQITFHQAKDGDPSWSPDGSEIVFVSERDGVRNLYIVGADGLNLRQLIANPVSDQSPDWSPVSEQIAFVSLGESSPDIFVINSDGSGQTNLTNHPANDLSPVWSPDGSQIFFVSDRDGRNQPYLMNADGSDQTRLADIEGEVLFASWSQRNDWIAMTVVNDPDIDIYIIKPDGTHLNQITEEPEMDAMPVWMDGPEVSFIGFVSTRGGNAELYKMDSQGSVTAVTDLGVTIGFPDWTPHVLAGSTAGLTSFTSQDGTLSFRYPSDWTLTENETSSGFTVGLASEGEALSSLLDWDFSQPALFFLGDVVLLDNFDTDDPAVVRAQWLEGFNAIFPLEGGLKTIVRPDLNQVREGYVTAVGENTVYVSLVTIDGDGRFGIFALGISESGLDMYGPAAEALLDSIELELLTGSVEGIDFTDPTAVLEAVFAAARNQDFSYLADLCDPMNLNDVDTRTLCELTPDHPDAAGFLAYFATGQIVGEVEYIEGGSDTFARINFLYGPNGDLTETMELILRDGLWYLLDM